MEEVMTKPKQSYVFDHKLTDEEIEQLIENYDYDPKYLDPDYDDGNTELELLHDRFGNPMEPLIRMWYERRHGLDVYSEPMTLDELFAEWAQIYEETSHERD